MISRKAIIIGLVMLVSIVAFGQDADEAKQIKTILRPELVDSTFCGVEVPIEGTYHVHLYEVIEIDVKNPGVLNCGPDRVTVLTENEKIVRPYKKQYAVFYDTGDSNVSCVGNFFKAVKKGETTITIKMENLSAPYTTMYYEYHIVVE